MRKHRIWMAGAALGALSLASCQMIEDSGLFGQGEAEAEAEAETESKPFIDPLTLSQNRCGGSEQKPVNATTASEIPPEFSFGEPFALPGEVTAHFHYPVSTENEEAQLWFDTGLTHMANFNHDEAIAAFRKAQSLDPACAMCFWGEGLAFGSNINAPFEAPRGAAGLIAAEEALARVENANEKEAALIEALATRYSASDSGETVENAADFANAMDAVSRNYADDKIILSLAAEANMDTQPWDYWEPGARVPAGRTARTLELLETALEIDPDFAPAIHLYIHTTESSMDPFRAEDFADRLQDQSLGVGHLVHMPSHIYLRLGRWQKSHKANIDAIAADEAYIAGSENAAFYGSVYYPHNVHFVVSSSQYAGDADTALEMSEKLTQLVQIPPEAPNPLAEHIAASAIFANLLFSDDETVLGMPEPAAAHLYMRTAWHYARGVARVSQGDIANAEAELAEIGALKDAPGFADYAEMFAAPLPGISDIARLTLEGRIHAAKGDLSSAIESLDAAADTEAQIPYFEPTWWYYPTRQTLGMYLLQDGQHDRAEREFFRTLINAPNNAYALFGLAETYKAQGDERSEAYSRDLFNDAWMGADGQTPELADL